MKKQTLLSLAPALALALVGAISLLTISSGAWAEDVPTPPPGTEHRCQEAKDCDDLNRCTLKDCIAGKCVSKPLFDDGDACTDDFCDSRTGDQKHVLRKDCKEASRKETPKAKEKKSGIASFIDKVISPIKGLFTTPEKDTGKATSKADKESREPAAKDEAVYIPFVGGKGSGNKTKDPVDSPAEKEMTIDNTIQGKEAPSESRKSLVTENVKPPATNWADRFIDAIHSNATKQTIPSKPNETDSTAKADNTVIPTSKTDLAKADNSNDKTVKMDTPPLEKQGKTSESINTGTILDKDKAAPAKKEDYVLNTGTGSGKTTDKIDDSIAKTNNTGNIVAKNDSSSAKTGGTTPKGSIGDSQINGVLVPPVIPQNRVSVATTTVIPRSQENPKQEPSPRQQTSSVFIPFAEPKLPTSVAPASQKSPEEPVKPSEKPEDQPKITEKPAEGEPPSEEPAKTPETKPAPVSEPVPPSQCATNADCDDKDKCTKDGCVEKKCIHEKSMEACPDEPPEEPKEKAAMCYTPQQISFFQSLVSANKDLLALKGIQAEFIANPETKQSTLSMITADSKFQTVMDLCKCLSPEPGPSQPHTTDFKALDQWWQWPCLAHEQIEKYKTQAKLISEDEKGALFLVPVTQKECDELKGQALNNSANDPVECKIFISYCNCNYIKPESVPSAGDEEKPQPPQPQDEQDKKVPAKEGESPAGPVDEGKADGKEGRPIDKEGPVEGDRPSDRHETPSNNAQATPASNPPTSDATSSHPSTTNPPITPDGATSSTSTSTSNGNPPSGSSAIATGAVPATAPQQYPFPTDSTILQQGRNVEVPVFVCEGGKKEAVNIDTGAMILTDYCPEPDQNDQISPEAFRLSDAWAKYMRDRNSQESLARLQEAARDYLQSIMEEKTKAPVKLVSNPLSANSTNPLKTMEIADTAAIKMYLKNNVETKGGKLLIKPSANTGGLMLAQDKTFSTPAEAQTVSLSALAINLSEATPAEPPSVQIPSIAMEATGARGCSLIRD